MKEPCWQNYLFKAVKDGENLDGWQASGQCCCNCEWQRPAMCHPWNTNEFTRGRISTQIGYVCMVPEFYPDVIFMDNQHGMCECWTERDYSKYPPEKTMEALTK